MEVEHPAYHADVQRGKPTKAPTGEPIDPETGTFETDDEAGATAAMDALTSTYAVEYADDGTVLSGAQQPPASAGLDWDPRAVDGVGDTLAARIAAANDTVADIATGTDDTQPEEDLAAIEGVDRDVAGEVVAAALDAADEGVSEASIDVVAPETTDG